MNKKKRMKWMDVERKKHENDERKKEKKLLIVSKTFNS